jgi:hypothetical protein
VPSYPSSIFPGNTRVSADMSAAETHATWHDDLQAEVIAIQSTLSTSPQGAFASVKARLDNIDTRVIRRRDSRSAGNYGTGTNSIAGTNTVTENVGGITGAGSTSTPYIVPVSCSYAISGWFQSPNPVPSDMSIIITVITTGVSVYRTSLYAGTTNKVGDSITVHLRASDEISFQLGNASGSAWNSVSFNCEIVKVSN